MIVTLRDSAAGHLVRFVYRPTALQYAEEQPGFVLPPPQKPATPEPATATQDASEEEPKSKEISSPSSPISSPTSSIVQPRLPVQIVDWYSDVDVENPHNWALSRKLFVSFQLGLYVFAVYSSSSIITSAEQTFIELYGVSPQQSSLVLSLYVLGYGCGPLLFSPLSEMPRFGRNPPYMIGLFLFVVLTMGLGFVDNYRGICVLRFLQGFVGGPVLATGGATLGDMFSFNKLPYAMSGYAAAAFGGPALGPLLSGYAVTLSTWRWAVWEILILGGVTFALLFFCMPETNAETILLKRAQRLRHLTGQKNLRSQSEIKEEGMKMSKVILSYLTTPFRITTMDAAIAFVNIYTALTYAIYYSFFESFPLVYLDIYGMSVGLMGVVFVSILISCAVGLVIYTLLVRYHFEKYTLTHGIGMPEHRLLPAVYSAALLPGALFLFGWTSRPSISWAVPTLGVVVYGATAFIIMQCIFIYLPTSYPRYAASLFAMNTFLRSALAATAIHFARPLFASLEIGPGCSLLAALNAVCFLGMLVLYLFGQKMRARSKFAETY